MIMEYELIRSQRRTLSMEIKEGRLIVRAPWLATKRQIDRFVEERRAWIEKHMEKARVKAEQSRDLPRLTEKEIEELARAAMEKIPARVAYYAPLVGVRCGRITIRNQKTRWGSCSSKGNLNFNCLLMLAPPQVLDSVVVHELCHLLEANHSPRFYAHVRRVYPEYDQWNRWLKENGHALMARMWG